MKKRILICDDDASVRESLAQALACSGLEPVMAASGDEAIETAARQRLDLVLLDLKMPGTSGWDTFERLTREHPLVPIIIITARPNQLFTAVGAGAGALLEKPLDIPKLLDVMTNLLHESERERLARLAGRQTEFHYIRSGRLDDPTAP